MTDKERYEAAAHAMQSGVAAMMNYSPPSTSPKHLRVGVNAAFVQNAALLRLLVDKGVFALAEYEKYLADEMEREVERYQEALKRHTGKNIKLA